VSALGYHADVFRDRGRVLLLVIAFAVALFAAAPAHADTSLPANADVGVGSAVNLDTFTRAVATRYHVELRRVVAADIDLDGDVDFVAATDGGLRVWVNDGRGHLTAKTPQHGVASIVIDSDVAWNGDSSRRDLSVQNELPSSRVHSYAHAPPPANASVRFALKAARVPSPTSGARIPRAPPR
jgi:hypothetical protein